MKKEVTAVICVVLAIWFFFMGFELGIYKERKSAQDSTSNIVTVPTVTSTEPTSSQPDTTMPTSAEPTTAEPTTIQPTSENPTESTTKKKDDQTTEPTTKKDNDPSSMSKEEIIAEMKKAFKTVKAEQNMTAKKDEEISVQLTKLSAESLKNMVNSVIQNLVGAEHITYTFVNGTATPTVLQVPSQQRRATALSMRSSSRKKTQPSQSPSRLIHQMFSAILISQA